MERITSSPFGRPLSHADLAGAALADAPAPLPRADKWQVLRDLGVARHRFGVTDRDLAVLSALLSFHKGDLEDGGPIIAFPSNRALCERAHGMAESTLRRRLAALVRAGLVVRHDSPNGKRYRARYTGAAFGFDLRPLLVRAPEIAAAAERAREEAEALRRLRERTRLMLRDAVAKLGLLEGAHLDLVAELAEIGTLLRRKPVVDALAAIAARVASAMEVIDRHLDAKKPSGCAAHSGRHYQSSTEEPFESEPGRECAAGGAVAPNPQANDSGSGATALPLPVVLKACPDIATFAVGQVRRWSDLRRETPNIAHMLGISVDALAEAERVMGPEAAATTVAAILQNARRIRSPGGYLRALSSKAAEGAFSPGPMVMALLRAEGSRRANGDAPS